MRLLALIPARGGSKGIPRKNIAILGGRPLITWTIEAALNAAPVVRVLVSTDVDDIADVARAAGAEVPFLRPPDLSNDAAPALPVIRHAIDWLERNEGWTADAVAYLQPTSPFRDAIDIEAAYAVMDERGADSVVSVVRVPHNMTPASVMLEQDGWLSFSAPEADRQFSRQAKAALLARNGPAILLGRRPVFDAGLLYGARIAAYEMPKLASLDVDEPEDLALAEAVLPLVTGRRSANNVIPVGPHNV